MYRMSSNSNALQNRYQQVKQFKGGVLQQPHHHNLLVKDDDVQQNKTDSQYFGSLRHYKAVFYSGQGAPYFLQNQHWSKSLSCIIFLDVIFLICMTMFIISGNDQQMSETQRSTRDRDSLIPSSSKSQKDNLVVILSTVVCLILINTSFFLCQFMNPGIRNPSSITQEQFGQDGKKICQHCCAYKTLQMDHCKQCGICVWGLDHHCGFFNKCIGGWQKWAFYVFLTSLFAGFLLIIVSMGLVLTFQ